MPDQTPDPKPPASWLDTMSAGQRAFVQLGFAGLVAVMFFMQSRDFANEARANREMYREEQHAMRAEIRAAIQSADARGDAAEKRVEKIAASVIELSFEMRRTADALRSAGLKVERAAEKVSKEEGTTAPPPRVKGEWPALFKAFKVLP